MTVQIVVPLFDESVLIEELLRRLEGALEELSHAGVPAGVVAVDDGSRDGTLEMLRRAHEKDPRFGYLSLSRNFGHQAAIGAGLDHADADAVIVMDGDLQDPPELIPEMVRRWRGEGLDVLYCVRRTREEGWLKRALYAGFYRLFNLLAGFKIPADTGDFALMSRRAYVALRELPERVRFLRGLRHWIGYRQAPFPYDRPARAGGRPKYGFRSLYRLATDGLASFSMFPLRIAQFLSFVFGVFSLATLTGLLVLFPQDQMRFLIVLGFLSCFSFSMLFLCLYVLGAYLARVVSEIKRRPLYLVAEYVAPRTAPPQT